MIDPIAERAIVETVDGGAVEDHPEEVVRDRRSRIKTSLLTDRRFHPVRGDEWW